METPDMMKPCAYENTHGDRIQANQQHDQPAHIGKIKIQPGPKIVGNQPFGELGGHVSQQLGAHNGENGR